LRTLDDVIGDRDVVVLAASGFSQNSGEDWFGNGMEGVFTHFLIRRLRANITEAASTTRDGIRDLTKDHYEQLAELHGRKASWDKPLIQQP
jgi:hypothetical protein